MNCSPRVREYHDWGYSEIYMGKVEDCFSPDEVDEAIRLLTSLPADALSQTEIQLLAQLKGRRKQRS